MSGDDALAATYFDGRRSQGTPVRIWRDGERLRIQGPGIDLDPRLGSLAISPRLGRTPRRIGLSDGAEVECPDAPMLADWLPTRSRMEAMADWLERRWPAVAAGAVTMVVAGVLFVQVGLPWMADRVARSIPPAVEAAVAQQVMTVVEAQWVDPTRLPHKQQLRLRAGFERLIEGLPRQADYRLEFRRGTRIGPNALALPAGIVIVTDELVEMMEDDAQVLAVLAHEIGHHEGYHGMRGALQSSALVLLIGFVTGDAASVGSLAASVPAVLLQNGYTRDFERDADAFAVELLRDRGYDPLAFAGAMRRMRALTPDTKGVAGYLSTHPDTDERIEAAERAAARE